jgi:hypothetical protein
VQGDSEDVIHRPAMCRFSSTRILLPGNAVGAVTSRASILLLHSIELSRRYIHRSTIRAIPRANASRTMGEFQTNTNILCSFLKCLDLQILTNAAGARLPLLQSHSSASCRPPQPPPFRMLLSRSGQHEQLGIDRIVAQAYHGIII